MIFTIAALGRSNSTPGLVETLGQVPLEEMWVNPVEPERPLVPVSTPTPLAHHLHQQQQLRHAQNSAASNSSIHSSEEDKSNKGLLGLTPKINFYTSGKLITTTDQKVNEGRALRVCPTLSNYLLKVSVPLQTLPACIAYFLGYLSTKTSAFSFRFGWETIESLKPLFHLLFKGEKVFLYFH